MKAWLAKEIGDDETVKQMLKMSQNHYAKFLTFAYDYENAVL